MIYDLQIMAKFMDDLMIHRLTEMDNGHWSSFIFVPKALLMFVTAKHMS